jgi:hypothetical protein
MILGLPTVEFTLLHVVISVIAILSGFIVLGGLYGAERLPGWTALFLITTALTSISGFFFPNTTVTPGQAVGALSLAALVPTVVARYGFRLRGAWRWIYAGGAVAVLYLNVFVLIAQLFAKVTVLQPLAPTQSEPPFLITELVVLVAFVLLGIAALVTFRPERRQDRKSA